jgi:predicted acyl esterase
MSRPWSDEDVLSLNRSEERIFITLRDGTRLAATLYLPGKLPAPAILEALPYRKDDLTSNYSGEYRRLRDEGGYAVARVDVRGTGSSEGIASDEYPEQEQSDLTEVIAWCSDQEWCSGAVGMYGTSYSGFNAIQVAMEQPPALKAIVAIYATDDRYTDDVHYEGGALRALDQIDYCLYMTPMNALPPVPAVYGEGWRDAWAARVGSLEPWLFRWLEEQTYGPYWRHGSLRSDYSAIRCPTMIVAGWADGYRNATFRAFERLEAPTRLLIGPWPHASTETCLPGPHIDLVPEMIRWWDRWLKGEPNEVDKEPPIAVFVRRSTKPEPDLAEMRGEWRYEDAWPPARSSTMELDLTGGRGAVEALAVRGDVGRTAHLSCAGVLPWGQPEDQRPDEAFSLVYDWPAVDEVEVLGYPRLVVSVAADRPVAFLSAKLCDVFEDGTSALVSRGFLNLTHRGSHERPEPLIPGQFVTATIDLSATSWAFESGHRIRLDLAGTDWPNVWPPPEPVTLSIDAAASRLLLPVVTPALDATAPRFRTPSSDGVATKAHGSDDRVRWGSEHDILARTTSYVVDHGSAYDVEVSGSVVESYNGVITVSTVDPGAASAEGRVRYSLAWPEATVSSEVHATLTSDAFAYVLDMTLSVSEGDTVRWERRWNRRFERHLA